VNSTTGDAPALLSRVGPPTIGAITAIAAWWSATAVFHIRSFFLPAPPEIVHRFL
jgi:NitT/TauT family transport system permease protein